jgi:hypothetical protein
VVASATAAAIGIRRSWQEQQENTRAVASKGGSISISRRD